MKSVEEREQEWVSEKKKRNRSEIDWRDSAKKVSEKKKRNFGWKYIERKFVNMNKAKKWEKVSLHRQK